MATPSVTINRIVSIETPDMNSPWQIKDVELIDGREFVKLDSHDKGFLRFAFGNRKPAFTFISKLKELRTNATAGTTEGIFGNEVNPTKYATSKLKRQKKSDGLDKIVDVSLPGIEYGDHSVSPIVMSCKPSLDSHTTAVIELTTSNLAYIKLAMNRDADNDDVNTKVAAKLPKGIVWRQERGAYVVHNGQAYKSFAVKRFATKDIALNHAVAWLEAEPEHDLGEVVPESVGI